MTRGPGWRWLIGAVMPLAALVAGAQAGEVTYDGGKGGVISIGARIDAGDEAVFHGLAAANPTTLITVTGPGGKVGPALVIGREIRARGLRTLVPAGASCASACALIWLAGSQRLLGAEARIGFHALSAIRPGEAPVETHAFDGELIRYLTGLGYAMDVTATIVNTPSVLIHWREAIELNANGIATQPYP